MSQILKPKTTKILIVSLLVVAIGGFAHFILNKKDTNTDNQQPTQIINYNPPTDQEKQAGDDVKKSLAESENNQSNNGSSSSVDVLITDASQYGNAIEVRAFVPNYFKDGTCTVVFTKGTDKIEKITPAYRDSSTTVCTNPKIDRGEFPVSGDWKVVVIYTSSDVSGMSQTQTIKIK